MMSMQLQLLLLLASLYVYQNSRDTEEDVGVDESVANNTAVYITNRFYQTVITADDELRVVERTGANIFIAFIHYLQTILYLRSCVFF